ncbi:putative deoxyribonuclease TATDN1 [Thelohanellus kitauei]|uniref:Deoxyribonuclease TATDN1 n=1 Tax=Thelohanellus kitauei TaxID=669202 RepID=A0A0C2M944_THEKT|nr:putative deoxyribonuclease TATDN1 [Thelohanellus kitauei]
MTEGRLIDIGVNLNDPMFQGIYNEKQVHESDLEIVIKRAFDSGVQTMINLNGSISELQTSLSNFESYNNIYHTAGVHPTRCMELENNESQISELTDFVNRNRKIIAIGEIGLDYDRLHFCDENTQKKWFKTQLTATSSLGLPYIFHMRNATADFLSILEQFSIRESVVHCFTGDINDADTLIKQNLSIGLTGCSLKTIDTVEAIKIIPIDKILIETDSPWCKVRPSFSGYQHIVYKPKEVKPQNNDKKSFIKCRQEPALVSQIYEAVASIKGVDYNVLVDQVFHNFRKIFKIVK